MAFLLRKVQRSGLLYITTNVGLSWSRGSVYLRSIKCYLTTRQFNCSCKMLSSDTRSSWTQVDIDKVMEEEEKSLKNKRLSINVKVLFDEKGSSPKITSADSPALNIAEKSDASRVNKHAEPKLADRHSTPNKKSHGKRTKQGQKDVNALYSTVQIPPNFPTTLIKDFDFMKFVEQNSTEVDSEEVVERKSEFGNMFQSIADDMLKKEVYVPNEGWETMTKCWTDNGEETIRVPQRFAKHWPLHFMTYFSNTGVGIEQLNKYEVIRSLWDYSQKYYQNRPPPLLMATYLNMLVSVGKDSEAFDIYADVNERMKGLPEISVYTQIVSALLFTSKWKDCKTLTEKMEKFYGMLRSLQDCWFMVACAHLVHGDLDEYEDIMKRLIKEGYDPMETKVAIQLLVKMDLESGKKFLQTCKENLWLPGIDVTNGILSMLERDSNHTWKVTPTEIENGGQCKHCNTKLTRGRGLTGNQFKMLQSEALAALLDGKDIYLKSNPAERRTFLSFCEKYGPFDVVVDGLNLFYARMQHGKRNMQEVVTMLKMKYPEKTNILIVMRHHLLKKLGVTMEKDVPAMLFRSYLFPLRNESEDDPYLLMAALSSGPDCMVVSNDDFSDQSHAFGSNLRPIFGAWQRTNQIFYNKEMGGMNLKWPKQYEHSIQEHSDGIHIPFSLSLTLAAKIRPPDSWLCCVKEPMS